MNIKTSRCFVFTIISLVTLNVNAAGINVPDDFPGNFHMDLLSGFANWDDGNSQHYAAVDLDTTSNQIPFAATSFIPDGTGAGISTISTDDSTINIGNTLFFGFPMTYFLEGIGTGSIDDIDGTQGHWNLTMPLFAEWNTVIYALGDIEFSSAASYDYFGSSGSASVSGDIMNYETGDTFLVGQTTIIDPTSPFVGVRITIGLNGNDPAVVPVPAAVWLFSSGLICLIGFSRREKV